jgi:tetratricopeptide (TPR) repeat protein
VRSLGYNEAITLDPQNAGAWYNKGSALYDQGKHDEAIKAYDEAIRLDPNFAAAWTNKGVALEALGNTTEANAAFAKAKELRV